MKIVSVFLLVLALAAIQLVAGCGGSASAATTPHMACQQSYDQQKDVVYVTDDLCPAGQVQVGMIHDGWGTLACATVSVTCSVQN